MPLSTPGGTSTWSLADGGSPARAAAAGAGIGDPDPLAAAGRAGGRDLEEAPGLDDLAPAAAVVAGRGDRPLLGPRPAASAQNSCRLTSIVRDVPRAASTSSISSFISRSGPGRGPRLRSPKRSPNRPPPKMSLKADMMSSVERKSWNAAPSSPAWP